MANKDDINYLKFTLNNKFHIDRHTYFKNLAKKCSADKHRKFCLMEGVYSGEDFIKKIKDEIIINKYYEDTFYKLKNNKIIKTLENGLYVLGKTMLLYCIKDEDIEDNFISDLKNIKCILHEEYDKPIKDIKTKEIQANNEENNKINDNKDNRSFKSNSKYDKDAMTGIKNRALVLEFLVNFYFKQFEILPLPNLLLNLDYKFVKKNVDKKDTLINLFFEWDGCYFYEGKGDITFSTEFILPFNKEIKYKINKNQKSQKIENDILIKNNCIVLIEVKTHFPKEKEEDPSQNLEHIIKIMFVKVNYFVGLYSEILKKSVKKIKIILLYDQNRLMNYKDNILDYLEKYKKILINLGDYELYFDILYIIPSIGKLSLNYVNQKLIETNKKCKLLVADYEKNKADYEKNKADNEKIKADNEKIKAENKTANNRILKLEKELKKFIQNYLQLMKNKIMLLKKKNPKETNK